MAVQVIDVAVIEAQRLQCDATYSLVTTYANGTQSVQVLWHALTYREQRGGEFVVRLDGNEIGTIRRRANARRFTFAVDGRNASGRTTYEEIADAALSLAAYQGYAINLQGAPYTLEEAEAVAAAIRIAEGIV
jgi:hypothetical protein